MNEFDLIAMFRAASPRSDRVRLGIGDDCAALMVTPGRELVVTCDMLMDGRHFRLDQDPPAAIGTKAMGVNLSDIAAMAAVPLAAVVAVALPRNHAAGIAPAIHAGMVALADPFGVAIIGGDTNAWDGPLVLSVTVLGESSERGVVRRSGARPGDAIFVTGPLGGSLAGRHLAPVPRVREALALHAVADLHALIDLSDGLSSDLGHILDESGQLGAILDAESLPIHADAHAAAARDGRTPLDHVLNDGEDFELCFTLAAADADRLVRNPPENLTLARVGSITAEPGLWLRVASGALQPLARGGFDHLAKVVIP